MSDRGLPDLEARLARALESNAPRPDPGLAARLLARTAEIPQRRGLAAFFTALITPMMVAAVVMAAIAVGFAISALPRNVGVTGPSPSPSVTDAAPTPSPSMTDATTPMPSPGVAECTNEQDGYTVAYPDGWWANEFVEGGEVDDVAACRFFAPEEIEIRPASQAAGMAIAIGRQPTAPPLEGEATTVGGREAVVLEGVSTEDGPFDPAGTRTRQYWIELGDEWLVGTTSDGPAWEGDYDENVEILDAMMDSLEFTSPG